MHWLSVYSFADECCPRIKILTEGPAKNHTSSSLTPYDFFQSGTGGKPIYRNSDSIYLYFYSGPNESNWQVGKYKNKLTFIGIKYLDGP